jgi:hypothetical protein
VGEFRIVHVPSLRFLKARLVFEDGGAFLVEGSGQTGRIECLARGGRARAAFSRRRLPIRAGA